MSATFGFFNLCLHPFVQEYDKVNLQKIGISLSKKQKTDSKKVLLFISLPYDTTKLKKILEWWMSFVHNFEKNGWV